MRQGLDLGARRGFVPRTRRGFVSGTFVVSAMQGMAFPKLEARLNLGSVAWRHTLDDETWHRSVVTNVVLGSCLVLPSQHVSLCVAGHIEAEAELNGPLGFPLST